MGREEASSSGKGCSEGRTTGLVRFSLRFCPSFVFNNMARFVFRFVPVRFWTTILCFQSLLRFVLENIDIFCPICLTVRTLSGTVCAVFRQRLVQFPSLVCIQSRHWFSMLPRRHIASRGLKKTTIVADTCQDNSALCTGFSHTSPTPRCMRHPPVNSG